MSAELCPVCEGKGVVTLLIYPEEGNKATDKVPTERTCHGCNGKGWVDIGGGWTVPYWPVCPIDRWYPVWPGIHYYWTGDTKTDDKS